MPRALRAETTKVETSCVLLQVRDEIGTDPHVVFLPTRKRVLFKKRLVGCELVSPPKCGDAALRARQ